MFLRGVLTAALTFPPWRNLLLLAVSSAYLRAEVPGEVTQNTIADSHRPAQPVPQTATVLNELSASFEKISERSGKAVIQIFARTYGTENMEARGALAAGENTSASGVVLSSDGYILTNAHAVKGARTVYVRFSKRNSGNANLNFRRRMPASIVGLDLETDLAVIKITGENLPYLEFSDSDQLKQGQVVLALGNPIGLDNSVSLGIVSAVSRQIKTDDPLAYIQTDAPINPGNSGGPLLDTNGRVVGINTFILSQSGGSEGIGFAIPSNLARSVYEQLKSQGRVERANLGIVAQTIDPNMADGLGLETDRGIIVSDLEPDSPAMAAGIKPDDVITAVNGRTVGSIRQFQSSVFLTRPGDSIKLRVERMSVESDIAVQTKIEPDDLHRLAELVNPTDNGVPQLGIVGVDITGPVHNFLPDLRRPAGVVVVGRSTDTPYAGAAIEVGDVIYEMNRQVIDNLQKLKSSVGPLRAGSAVVLLVERDGQLRYLSLELN